MFLVIHVSYQFYIYLEPIMALRLNNHYGVALWFNNFCFAVLPISYMFGSMFQILFLSVFKVRINLYRQLVFGQVFLIISVLMCGPSLIFPDKLEILFAGLFGQGFFVIFIIAPLLPMIQAEIVEEFGQTYADSITDITSGLFLISC